MRILIIFLSVIIYMFVLVLIESELVKIEARKEVIERDVIELENEKRQLQSSLIDLANLAHIESAAKQMGFVFPQKDDILGVVE